jgi:hypothetical protein
MKGTLIKAGLSGPSAARPETKDWFKDISQQEARQVLQTVAVKLRDKHGTLALHTGGAGERELSLVRKWGWTQSHTDLKNTAQVVRGLLERACQGLPEHRQTVIAKAFETYLSDNKHKVGTRLSQVVNLLDGGAPSAAGAWKAGAAVAPQAKAASAPPNSPKSAQAVAKEVLTEAGLNDRPSFVQAHLDAIVKVHADVKSQAGKVLSTQKRDEYAQFLRFALGRATPQLWHQLHQAVAEWTSRMEAAGPPHPDTQDRAALLNTLAASKQAQARHDEVSASRIRSMPLPRLYDAKLARVQEKLLRHAMVRGLSEAMVGSMVKTISINPGDSLEFFELAQAVAGISVQTEAMVHAASAADRVAARTVLLKGLSSALLNHGVTSTELAPFIHQAAAFLGPDDSRLVRLHLALVQSLSPGGASSNSILNNKDDIALRGLNLAVSRELLHTDGRLDTAALGAMPGHLEAIQVHGPSVRRHMDGLLRQLSADTRLSELINSTPAPLAQEGPAAVLIRASLGLRGDEPVTALHARQAMLSALLTPLRQGVVGSCFATAMAIRMQQRQPLEMARDLRQLIEHGELRLSFPSRPSLNIPISTQTGALSLQQNRMLNILPDRSHKMSRDPALQQALGLAGLTDGAIEGAINGALKSLVELQRSAEKSAAQVLDPSSVRVAGDALAPATGAATPTELKTTPERILEEVLLKRHGLNRQDLADLHAIDQLAAEIYSSNAAMASQGGRTMTANEQAAQKALADKNKLIVEDFAEKREAFEPKAAAVTLYNKQLSQAVSGFHGATEDRLLRAWEYTLSGAAEQAAGARHQVQLSEALSTAIGLSPAQSARAPVSTAMRPGTPAHEVASEFIKLLREDLRYAYDGSLLSTQALDGSSSRGGFVLHYRDPANPERARPLLNQVDFQQALENLYLRAGDQVVARLRSAADTGAAGEPAQVIALLVGQQGSRIWSSHFIQTVESAYRENSSLEGPHPWVRSGGHSGEAAYAARFGHDLSAVNDSQVKMPDLFSPGLLPLIDGGLLGFLGGSLAQGRRPRLVHPEEAVEFLIDTLKAQASRAGSRLAQSADAYPHTFSLPLAVSSHSFLLKPAQPASGAQDVCLRDAWQDKAPSAKQWLKAQLHAPSQAQAGAALAQAQAERLLSATAQKLWTQHTHLAAWLGMDAQGAPDHAQWCSLVHADLGEQALSISLLRESLAQRVRQRMELSTDSQEVQFLSAASQQALRDDLSAEADKDEKLVLRIFDDAIVQHQAPPKLVFADTNWGGVSQALHLSLLYNPGSGQSEFWLVDDPARGQLISRLDNDSFLKDWSVIPDLGLMGETAPAPPAAAPT